MASGFFALPLPLIWIADQALAHQIADHGDIADYEFDPGPKGSLPCVDYDACGRDDDPTEHDRPRGGWVARAYTNTLPVFDTLNGNRAYAARQSDANPFDTYPDF